MPRGLRGNIILPRPASPLTPFEHLEALADKSEIVNLDRLIKRLKQPQRAGDALEFTIQTKDSVNAHKKVGGDKWTVVIKDVDSERTFDGIIVDAANGQYKVACKVTTAGKYTIDIRLHKRIVSSLISNEVSTPLIPPSDLQLTIEPGEVSAENSELVFDGAKARCWELLCVAGRESYFLIRAKDQYGNAAFLNKANGEEFVATCANKEFSILRQDRYEGGVYRVLYYTEKVGTFPVTIKLVNNKIGTSQEIADSPLRVSVWPNLPVVERSVVTPAEYRAGEDAAYTISIFDKYGNAIQEGQLETRTDTPHLNFGPVVNLGPPKTEAATLSPPQDLPVESPDLLQPPPERDDSLQAYYNKRYYTSASFAFSFRHDESVSFASEVTPKSLYANKPVTDEEPHQPGHYKILFYSEKCSPCVARTILTGNGSITYPTPFELPSYSFTPQPGDLTVANCFDNTEQLRGQVGVRGSITVHKRDKYGNPIIPDKLYGAQQTNTFSLQCANPNLEIDPPKTTDNVTYVINYYTTVSGTYVLHLALGNEILEGGPFSLVILPQTPHPSTSFIESPIAYSWAGKPSGISLTLRDIYGNLTSEQEPNKRNGVHVYFTTSSTVSLPITYLEPKLYLPTSKPPTITTNVYRAEDAPPLPNLLNNVHIPDHSLSDFLPSNPVPTATSRSSIATPPPPSSTHLPSSRWNPPATSSPVERPTTKDSSSNINVNLEETEAIVIFNREPPKRERPNPLLLHCPPPRELLPHEVQPTVSTLEFNFGRNNARPFVKCRVYSKADTSCCSLWQVQYSDNEETWHSAGQLLQVDGWVTTEWEYCGQHPNWRFLCLNPLANDEIEDKDGADITAKYKSGRQQRSAWYSVEWFCPVFGAAVAHYTQQRTGIYQIGMKINDEDVFGCVSGTIPLWINNITCPQKCSVELPTDMTVKQVLHIVILLKDKFGYNRLVGSQQELDMLQVHITGPNGHTVKNHIVNNHNGSYTVSIDGKRKGDYKLEVFYGKEEIPCKHNFTLIPAATDPESCKAVPLAPNQVSRQLCFDCREKISTMYSPQFADQCFCEKCFNDRVDNCSEDLLDEFDVVELNLNGLVGGPVGRTARFTLLARDKFGNASTHGNDNFIVRITPLQIPQKLLKSDSQKKGNESYEPMYADCEYETDGKYAVSYQVSQSGKYLLQIFLKGGANTNQSFNSTVLNTSTNYKIQERRRGSAAVLDITAAQQSDNNDEVSKRLQKQEQIDLNNNLMLISSFDFHMQPSVVSPAACQVSVVDSSGSADCKAGQLKELRVCVMDEFHNPIPHIEGTTIALTGCFESPPSSEDNRADNTDLLSLYTTPADPVKIGHGSLLTAKVDISAYNDVIGCYKVEYLPYVVGRYSLQLKHSDQLIYTLPFEVHPSAVVASKCRVVSIDDKLRICFECYHYSAMYYCRDCKQCFCDNCWLDRHKNRVRQSHKRSILGVDNTGRHVNEVVQFGVLTMDGYGNRSTLPDPTIPELAPLPQLNVTTKEQQDKVGEEDNKDHKDSDAQQQVEDTQQQGNTSAEQAAGEYPPAKSGSVDEKGATSSADSGSTKDKQDPVDDKEKDDNLSTHSDNTSEEEDIARLIQEQDEEDNNTVNVNYETTELMVLVEYREYQPEPKPRKEKPKKKQLIITLPVTGVSGRLYHIEVTPQDTVVSLKRKLYEYEGLPTNVQKLVSNEGKVLQDSYTLAECGIQRTSTVTQQLCDVSANNIFAAELHNQGNGLYNCSFPVKGHGQYSVLIGVYPEGYMKKYTKTIARRKKLVELHQFIVDLPQAQPKGKGAMLRMLEDLNREVEDMRARLSQKNGAAAFK